MALEFKSSLLSSTVEPAAVIQPQSCDTTVIRDSLPFEDSIAKRALVFHSRYKVRGFSDNEAAAIIAAAPQSIISLSSRAGR